MDEFNAFDYSGIDNNITPVVVNNGPNDAYGDTGSPLNDLFDFATSTFKGITQAAINVYQAKALQNLNNAQTNADILRQNQLNPPYTAAQRYTISLASIGAVVLLGTAFVLISRRKRRG